MSSEDLDSGSLGLRVEQVVRACPKEGGQRGAEGVRLVGSVGGRGGVVGAGGGRGRREVLGGRGGGASLGRRRGTWATGQLSCVDCGQW